MLSKTLWVLNLAEPITDIYYHSGDSIDSVKRPVVPLLASPITRTIIGAEVNDELAFVLSSFPLSCLHLKQATEAQSPEVNKKLLSFRVT